MPKDVMTPEWSRHLALLCQSSIWHRAGGQERKDKFIEAMEQYPNLDALPPRQKRYYQQVVHKIQQANEAQERRGRNAPR